MFTSVLLCCVLPAIVLAFPDGAPVDACVKAKPNQPYHGQSEPQPPHTNPFQIIASSSQYHPGSKITVTLQGSTPFRGFFVQARDHASGTWLGTFDDAPNTKGLPECSAVTHGDNKDKLQATLIWTAPNHVASGQVFFTGSIVKDYTTFWTDITGQVAH